MNEEVQNTVYPAEQAKTNSFIKLAGKISSFLPSFFIQYGLLSSTVVICLIVFVTIALFNKQLGLTDKLAQIIPANPIIHMANPTPTVTALKINHITNPSPTTVSLLATPNPSNSPTPAKTLTPTSPTQTRTGSSSNTSTQSNSSSLLNNRYLPTSTPSPSHITKLTVNTPQINNMQIYNEGLWQGGGPAYSGCVGTPTTTFSADGPGTVQITYYAKSQKSYTAHWGQKDYTFSQAGQLTDSYQNGFTGPPLQSGDAYTITATVTVVGNSSISAVSAPLTINNCGSLPPYPTFTQGNITAATADKPTISWGSNHTDPTFPLMCNPEFSVNFNVNGSGTVGVLWQVTSSSSGGDTFNYNNGVFGADSIYNDVGYDTFSDAGSRSSSYYVRVAYTNPGDSYALTAKIFNPANGSVYATSNPTYFTCP